jgi:hypothetical protein
MLAVRVDGVTSWDRTRDLLHFTQALSQIELKPLEPEAGLTKHIDVSVPRPVHERHTRRGTCRTRTDRLLVASQVLFLMS